MVREISIVKIMAQPPRGTTGGPKYSFLNRRPINLNGQLSTIAYTQTCQGVSYLHFIKFHSGFEKLGYCNEDHLPT